MLAGQLCSGMVAGTALIATGRTGLARILKACGAQRLWFVVSLITHAASIHRTLELDLSDSVGGVSGCDRHRQRVGLGRRHGIVCCPVCVPLLFVAQICLDYEDQTLAES